MVYNKNGTDLGLLTLNPGGNELFHSFGIWMILQTLFNEHKLLNTYIESGVYKAITAKMVRNLLGPDVPMVLIDKQIFPPSQGWVPTGKIVDLRKANFKDFNLIDWKAQGIDPAKSIILFDDHMDQIRRIIEAKKLGFKHIIFDDNFIPGGGDIFSLRNACDGANFTVRNLITTGWGTRHHPALRCDNFHHTCTPLRPEMAQEVYNTLHSLVDVYFEFPPLGPPLNSYQTYLTSQYAHFESWPPPKSKIPEFREIIDSYIKPPLLTKQELLDIGFTLPRITLESSSYWNLVYLQLKD